MTRSKRQYGSGCLLKRGKGWAIRWREMEIAPDGTKRRTQRYEALGEVTRKQASDTLAQRLAVGGNKSQPTRSRVVFRTLASEWQAHVLPMYKRRLGQSRPGVGATGAVYELLMEDKRKAIELMAEERAEERDPETADGDLPPSGR